MSQTIVVTGAGGRLGAALVRQWKAAKEDVIGLKRADLDLSRPEQMRDALESLDFGVLVNCAAQTNVDRCETHFDEAMRINAQAVGELAEICQEKGARCIHISTDYVFDGEKETPYTEEDQAQPISRYGESKLAGEFALLNVSSTNLVVRVSWVFGPDRPSFVDQVLQKARTGWQRSPTRSRCRPTPWMQRCCCGLSFSRNGSEGCFISVTKGIVPGRSMRNMRLIAPRKRDLS